MIAHLNEMLDTYQYWLVIACVGVAVLAYCMGCLNGAVTVSRLFFKDDIRNYGSGNGGLTNFCRVYGGPLTVLVVLCDVLKAVVSMLFALKAVLSVLFAMWLFEKLTPDLVTFGKYWAGLFCLLGHMFPCGYQFRGGKGVLSGGFIAIMIDWRVALVVWGGFLILSFVTKYVSVGSVWAGLSFPFATAFVYHDSLLTVMGVVMGGLLVWKHRANIKRLITGKEPKFTFKMKGTYTPRGAAAQEPAEESAEEASPADAGEEAVEDAAQ